MRRLQRVEIGVERRSADPRLPGGAAEVEQPAAPAQEQPEERQEPPPPAHREQVEDIAGVETVDPVPIPRGMPVGGEQEFGQPAPQQPAVEAADAEGLRALLPEDRTEVDGLLAAGQRVAEPPRGREGGGTGGEEAQGRELVRRDLEDEARVGEPLDLVEHQHGVRILRGEKGLRVLEGALHRRQVAVQEAGLGEHPGERGLSRPADAGQVDDRPPGPGVADPFDPEGAFEHESILRMVVHL